MQEAFCQQVALKSSHSPMIIGGKSIGGRVAGLLIDELEVLGGIDLHLHHDYLSDMVLALVQGYEQGRYTIDLKAANSNLLADKSMKTSSLKN